MPIYPKLQKKRDFDRVYRKGRSINGKHMYLKITQNTLGKTRLKVIVSNKISKKAVIRNRNRRRIDEVIKAIFPKIQKGYDGIFQVLGDTQNIEFSELKKEVESLLVKGGILHV